MFYTGNILKKSKSKSAGYDLKNGGNDVTISAGGSARINTKTKIFLGDNLAIVYGRSGLAMKHDIIVFNGIIDPDYTGNIHVFLRNTGKKDYMIKAGERIAQLVVFNSIDSSLTRVDQERFDNISKDSERGNKGFGSTGKL